MKKIAFVALLLAFLPVLSFSQAGYTVFEGHTNLVCGVSFSPDGKKIASAGSWDNMVKIWDPATGTEIHSINDFEEAQMYCLFAKNGSWLVCAGNSGTISVFDTKSWGLVKTYKISTGGEAWHMDLSPNGETVAIACWDHNVYLLNLNTFMADRLQGHTAAISGVAFSPDGKYVASASDDQTVIIWDVKKKKKKKALKSHTASVSIVDYSADGKTLLSGGDDKQVVVWNAKNGKLIKHIWMRDMVRALACSPDGKYVAIAGTSTDPNIYIYDAKTYAQLAKLEYHTSFINSLCFSPDSRLLLSGSSDNAVVCWTYQSFFR